MSKQELGQPEWAPVRSPKNSGESTPLNPAKTELASGALRACEVSGNPESKKTPYGDEKRKAFLNGDDYDNLVD